MGESKEKEAYELTKKFESLSPKPVNPESISIYLEALKEGLDDYYVKNLAITGSYGSGKSSIIGSFQKKHENDFSFLNISLAEFEWEVGKNKKVKIDPNDSDKSKTKKRKAENFDKLVELSILQQIFYKVKPNEVPDSKLKRIRNISKTEIIGLPVAIVVWLISIYSLVKFNHLENLNPSNWNISSKFDWIGFLFFSLSALGLFLFIKKSIRWFFNARINRVSLKGLELGGEIEESILNKHLDEILYFFEKTPYDVVVIEDLDRQEELEIFTKLREINYLLNSSKQVISKNRKKVTFIYAVRDDILKEKDRTKFFDLVIPVIPFINSYNSNEKLREKLLNKENKSLTHPLTAEFIDDVSLYIDDMRLLLNICNEYEIYKENLNKGLKQNNILAIVIYKNMRPKDFVKLHNRKGNLYSLLRRARKTEILKSIIKSIETEQSQLRKEIANIEKELIQNARELNAIYLYHIRKAFTTNHIPQSIYIGEQDIQINELEESFYFQDIDKKSQIRYTFQGGYNGKLSVSFAHIEKLVSSDFSYEDRVAIIKEQNEDKTNQIEQRIDDLESKKGKANNLNLEAMFKQFKMEDFLSEQEKSDNLMLYFLRNGYIDENYQNYISYFYEVSLSREDNEFLISVTSESPLSFDFEIKNTQNVINRIQSRYFETRAILNFDLVSFILKNRSSNKSKLQSIFSFITSNDGDMEIAKEKFSFINSYLKNFPLEEDNSERKNLGKTDVFINEIIKRWQDLWSFIKSSSGVSKKDKETILNYILSVATDKSIKQLNVNKTLSRHIESSSDFLSTPLKSYEQKFATVFQILDIKFAKLVEPNKETKKLFDFVYEYNHYKINDDNISLVMKRYGLEKDRTSKPRFKFTDIVNSKADRLIGYIESEINEYVSYTNEIEEAYVDEDEEAIVRIYNNGKLKEEVKSDFIRKETVRISDLSKITDESDYPTFFKIRKVVANWENVSLYFSLSEKSIDEILESYINDEENYSALSLNEMIAFDKNEDKDLIESLSIALITHNKFTFICYQALLKSIPNEFRYWKKIGFEILVKNKVQHLILSKFLSFSESNFEKISDKFSDFLVDYISVHQNDFISNYDEEIYPWTISQKEEFFDALDIETTTKVNIFEELEKSDVTTNTELSRLVCEVLAEYGYDRLDFEYLKSFFINSKSVENRVKLFNLNHDGLDNSQMIDLVKLLPYSYQKISEKQKKPKINKSETNLKFVEILKSKRLISSYKILDSYIRVVARYR